MKIELRGREINNEIDFHKQLVRDFGMEEYYECNLDALWNLLSASIERLVLII